MHRFIFYFLVLFHVNIIFPGIASSQALSDLPDNIDKIISKIDTGEFKNIDGFLVWKDDEIIGEKYWNSWNRDRPHMLQSVTKSITSLLIGIAIHEGYISGIKEPVLNFFQQYENIQNLDHYKRTLTLNDMLTMRTGMDWVEHPYEGSPLAKMNAQRNDWISFVLNTPMEESPGQTFIYNSGGVILLGGIIRSATDLSVQKFSDHYLFDPLDINSAEWWFTDHKGLPHTGGGLNMAAKDMLKIGRLVLQCGEWNDKQILSCSYIKKLYQNHQTEPIQEVGGRERGYSLLWHVFSTSPEMNLDRPSQNFIAAWGAHGQWIMVSPSLNMVAIFIGNTRNFEEEIQPVRIFYEELLSN